MNLSVSSAIEFVRASIDELSQMESDMLVSELDDRNLDMTVEKLLPAAIEYVHLSAPSGLLDGIILDTATVQSFVTIEDRVLDLNFKESTRYNILRMTAFKAGDSNILLSDAYYEDSPQARMQTEPYTQGQPDEPVIVLMGDSVGYKPHYRYYTTDLTQDDGDDVPFLMKYVPAPEPMEDQDGDYFVSARLRQSVLNYLVSLVLLAYKEANLAEIFKQKALEYFK